MEIMEDVKTPITSKDSLNDFQELHDMLYLKIKSLANGDGGRLDMAIVRILIESAMVIVEQLKDNNGKLFTGPEKRRIVVMVSKWVISDLAKEKVIDAKIASDVCNGIDLMGGVAVDLAIAGAKNLFNVGQELVLEKREKNRLEGKKPSCCGFL